jgi:hypothetical protein
VASVFPLRGGMLVLFSIQLLCLIFIRSGGIPQERFPCQGRFLPLTQPDTIEDDGDGDVDESFSDRCSSGSGAVWAFCLASGDLSGRLLGSFREKDSLRGIPGLPPGSLWGLGASGPCVGATGGLRFFPFLA